MKDAHSVTCPHCGAKLKVKRWGSFKCLKCQESFYVDEPEETEDAELENVDGSLDLDAEPTEPAPAPEPQRSRARLEGRSSRTPSEVVEERSQPARSPQWLLIAGGIGIALLGVGLGAWLFSPSGQPDRDKAVTSATATDPASETPSETPATSETTQDLVVATEPAKNDDTTPGATQTQTTKPRRSRGVPLFDSDVGAPASNSSTAGTSRTSRPAFNPSASTGTPSRAVESAWYKAPFGVVFHAGEIPWLNATQVLTEVASPNSDGWLLVLPPGEHVWQTSAKATPERRTVSQSFSQFYQQQKGAYVSGGRLNFDKLATATRPTAGAFQDPLLPHFWGNYFWQEQQPEAAIRFWKQAIRAEPTFAPAHLNLAFALKSKNKTAALRELALSVHCNPLDAYGIAAHAQQLREELAAGELVPTWSAAEYVPTTKKLSGEPQQVVQVLRNISQYSTAWQDRARALNNAGAYLNSRSMPEFAVEPLQEALAILVVERALDREPVLVSTLFENLQRAAKDSGLAEHTLYGWLKDSYR